MKQRKAILLAIMEQMEVRRLMSATGSTIEPIDGVGNNVANPNWGSAGTDLIRLAAAAYSDGIDSPDLQNDLSAREISNILNNQENSSGTGDIATVDQNSLSDFGYAFGQFMDHDMDNTPDGGAEFDIAVAVGDPIGPDSLPFTRSQTDPTTGTSTTNPAQQITTVTSYFDLSQVYGSSQEVADALRTFSGGLLKTSPGNMLPYDNTTYFTPAQIAALNMENDSQAVPESDLFAAGDVRANENVELTALQTLFLRNHNMIATELAKDHPTWTDQQLYDEARELNIAEYQQIIYTGWIPAVLGPTAIAKYSGYKKNVNATIANEFSTVAFRFGHSLLSPSIERLNNDGTDIADVSSEGADIPLSEDFFDPYVLNPTGAVDPLTGHTSSDIGPILKGDASGVSEADDTMAVEDVRNLLFGNGGLGGQDLMALDVQRGRDHGIPSYNALRVAMDLPAVTSFAQITSNPTVQKELEEAYPGGVNTIDAFEGGLAEDHVKGSDVGPLFQAIMVNQFTRLRDGDRFFYLNENFNAEENKILQQGSSLAKVIENNTNVTGLQTNVFLFNASISGSVLLPPGAPKPPQGQPGPFANLTVHLEDSDGDILATTQTDAHGNYLFNQLSGPSADSTIASGVSAVGDYKIVLELPNGSSTTSANIDIVTGDTNVDNINFVLNNNPPQQPPPKLAKANIHHHA
ncbi:MAG TPA: peroxidase family protein [Tepidisphaeraceae bacterium]|jgi:hypothetical protein